MRALPTCSPPPVDDDPVAECLRVRGTVQGVGFRPHVWRLAQELGIAGTVHNDGAGVLISAVARRAALDRLAHRLRAEAPPLARIEAVERTPAPLPAPLPADFRIGASRGGSPATALAADAATCAACVAEMLDPQARRHRYPLTNCTHCGPRLSFATGVPYDRSRTTMARWPMCADCRAEYASPLDRRFHAQPIACPACGPRVRLRRLDGRPVERDGEPALDDCDAAAALLARGEIVAIKGLGGYQLACDAGCDAAVARLRALKRRESKPFALLAADLDAVRRCCEVDAVEAAALQSAAAPIVLLRRRRAGRDGGIADGVAPGLRTLGFMLPSTGLHHLVVRRLARPLVLTSGNLSDEPQAITWEELRQRFPAGVEHALDHARPVARRVDDSVVRVLDGQPRVLRRARGHAPTPIEMPAGFAAAPPVLAYGGQLKNAFCLLGEGRAVLSQHIGDLDEAHTRDDWQRALHDLPSFFAFAPHLHACDTHPDYASTGLARQRAAAAGAEAVEVLHHHAHLAACLADNGWPLDGGPVLGVALDGLGLGEDGSWWGGEFALVDYRRFDRRGSFKAVALPGGAAAMREPWRNTYAQLLASLGWTAFSQRYGGLELHRFLAAQPRAGLDAMLRQRLNSPLASSCGRLFDAVAAALGLCRARASYEGQGAVELESCVDEALLHGADEDFGYPFAVGAPPGGGLPCIDPGPMWHALLDDLLHDAPPPTIAARFHAGLARAIVRMVDAIASAHALASPGRPPLRHVALSGGVWQNRVLYERVAAGCRAAGFAVLGHRRVPCNDGGIALGQAAVAAARALQPLPHPFDLPEESARCA